MASKRKTPRRSSSSQKRGVRARGSLTSVVPPSIYKVSGGVRPTTVPAGKRPGVLTLAEKTTLLKGMGLPGPGTIFATLSPSRPGVPNRAALVFERPRLLEGGEGYAWWRIRDPDTGTADFKSLMVTEGTGLKRLGIWFKSEAADRKYLVDCVVNRGLPKDWAGVDNVVEPFQVVRPDGSHVQTSSVPPGVGHVTFVVQTQDASWYGFMLSTSASWTFWSCEITRM
jgi:hypothetical protein